MAVGGFLALLFTGVLGKSGLWFVILAISCVAIYFTWQARKSKVEQGKPVSSYNSAIVCLVVVAVAAGLLAGWTSNRQSKKAEAIKVAEEKKAEWEAQKKKEEEARIEAAKPEDDRISDLADKKLSNISSFSTNGCGVDGAPPGSKTVNVISEAYTGYYTKEAGPFLEQVFRDYPDVYYVQMKGRDAGGDVIAFEMCRSDIPRVSHWTDWEYEPLFTTWVRNYWVDEEWRENQASNLPPSMPL